MTKLNTLFPTIRPRETIRQEIKRNQKLSNVFYSWTVEQQKDFLDMCSGARGVRVLADGFAKEILNPEYAPERLEEFLSLALRRDVKILTVLPNDSTRIANESALIVTDILVEFSDHSIANVEVQRIGYAFPNDAIHRMKQRSDTGLEIDLLQEYVFISLDIFKKILQNEGINNKLDAWLTFFSSDQPEIIAELISGYPQFQIYYEEMYGLCQNMERVMSMFSKELYELDRNTERYMFEEMQESIKEKEAQLAQKEARISEQSAQLSQKDARISEQSAQLSQKDAQISEQEKEISMLKAKLAQLLDEKS